MLQHLKQENGVGSNMYATRNMQKVGSATRVIMFTSLWEALNFLACFKTLVCIHNMYVCELAGRQAGSALPSS